MLRISIIVSFISLFSVFGQARTFTPPRTVQLDPEFLASLDDGQRSYLEEMLRSDDNATFDEDEFEIIDMDSVEMTSIAVSDTIETEGEPN